jgi:hypothetical protein
MMNRDFELSDEQNNWKSFSMTFKLTKQDLFQQFEIGAEIGRDSKRISESTRTFKKLSSALVVPRCSGFFFFEITAIRRNRPEHIDTR